MPATPTPKDRFTALDALALVRELRAIGPARVEKAFDAGPGAWSLTLHPPKEAKRELVIVPGRYAALLPGTRDHSEELSPVARELRRLLTGAMVRGVADPGGERYLELTLSRADEPDGIRVAVEFFGAGNLVVARGSTIAAVTRPRSWAHRTVRVGSEYARPPVRADPWTMTSAAIEAELARSRSDLASTLAARLVLGGPVAEEVIVRAGWSGSEPAAPAMAGTVRATLDTLLAEVGDRPAGFLYRRDGLLVDATPYPSLRWRTIAEEEPRPTFSEAAAEFFPTAVVAPPSPAETQARQAREEVERLVERQRRAVGELERAAADRREDADALLSHFQEADAALKAAQAAPEPTAEVRVAVGGRTVVFPVRRSVREAAQALYDESKRIAEKLAGARVALAETEARRSQPPAPAPAPVPAASAPSRRTFWFERYRWFIASDGAIVIAGRDAASNDLIVRRNLKDGDVYVHADLHGAASVIVKRSAPEAPVGEPSLREAAQWAVAFSKAWKAGYATGTAFWANPDQVSKAAASGEFVARGAWVIHGTKHFVRDVPLELALGVIRHAGQERWSVAPESAVRAHGEVRCLLTPGEERERSSREVELVRDLGIPRPVLQALLPAGGLSVRRP